NKARSLEGLVVAITGGARGIGLAVAQCCARAGMRVAIGDLDPELAGAAAAGLGRDHLGSGLDITSRDEVAAFIDATESQLGALDVLVNNAGVFTSRPYTDEPPEMTERVVLTNLLGTMVGTKIALQRMLIRDRGHIVNISSIGAALPSGGAV